MPHQFGHEMGGFGGMTGWPFGNWTGAQTPVGTSGQGVGFGTEQMTQTPWQTGHYPQMTQPFPPTGAMPWAGPAAGMGMYHPFAGQFGGYGFAPWDFFYQIENVLRQYPQLHHGLHQMLGNLLLNAPMQHFAPPANWGQFPWQQTMGFGGASQQQPFYGDTGYQQPWQQFSGGMGYQQPWQQFSGGAGQQTGGFRLTDEQITDMVNDCLDCTPWTMTDTDINVECRDGVVTLTGTLHNKFAKRMIGEFCWNLPGVNDVQNQVRVVTRRQTQQHGRGTQTTGRTGQTAQSGVTAGGAATRNQ